MNKTGFNKINIILMYIEALTYLIFRQLIKAIAHTVLKVVQHGIRDNSIIRHVQYRQIRKMYGRIHHQILF